MGRVWRSPALAAGWLAFLAALAFLALFFFYPVVSILRESLIAEGGLSGAPFREVLTDGYFRGRIGFTLWLALVSTVATVALGVPSAYVFARYDFPGRDLLRAVSTVPFVMPTIVVSFGFIALVGPGGVVNDVLRRLFGLEEPPVRLMNTFWIILLAHVFYNYTVVMRIVSNLWSNLDPRLEESARVLGADRWRAFRHVTLPLLLPAIAAAALLVFVFSFTSFGVVLILGGREFATLEVEIYTLTAKLFQLPLAGALSLVQLLFTFGFMFLYARLQERTAQRLQLRPRRFTVARRLRGRDWALVGLNAAVVLVLVLSPLLALVQRAFWVEGGYSLAYFRALFAGDELGVRFVPPLTAMRNSLSYALLSTAIAMPVGTAIAYRLAAGRSRWRTGLDALLMLPLGVSAVTLGFGFLISLNKAPLDLRATWVLLVIAHSLVAYPFVVRSVLAVLRGIDPALREVAAVLGAGPARVFREVDLPILWRALAIGALFAFAVSMGEFGATLLLVRPEFTTMPIAIFRSLSQPGAANLGQAMAMSTLLMAVSAAGFLIIERLRYRGVGEF